MNDCRLLSCGRLELQFARYQDRFAHEIGWRDGDRFEVIMRSIEGSDLDPWPISPPFQQIVEETVEGNPVLFGIGLSGNGHWSCSIDSNKADEARFDIACRISKPAHHLGSCYAIVPPFRISGVDRSDDEWTIATIVSNIPGAGVPGTQLRLIVNSGAVRIEQDEHRLNIVPSSDMASIATHRWFYKILVQ